MGFLLFRKALPAILALPVFAVLIALTSLLPKAFGQLREDGFEGFGSALTPLYGNVIQDGATMLAAAIAAVIFGAILASHIKATGVAEQIVRFAAEFGGDSPFALAIILSLVTALLFTTLGGLGAVIMVATLTLPVMRSVGISARTAGASFLFALSLGGTLNPVNWQAYKEILGLESDRIIKFALTVFIVFAIATVFYLAFKLIRTVAAKIIVVAITAAVVGLAAALVSSGFMAGFIRGAGIAALALLIAALAALWLAVIIRFIAVNIAKSGGIPAPAKPHFLAYAAVLVPLFHLLADTLARAIIPEYAESGITIPFIAALALGIFYSFLASFRRRSRNMDILMKSIFEGFKDAAPAALLMMGIGMLLKATMLPETSQAVQPLITGLIPQGPVSYVLTFTLLAPLALYRGPLNLWGMGSGLIGVLLGTGTLGAPMLMAAFFSVGMMQGVCDPTNTHNVWIANHEGVDVADLTKETVPWVWPGVMLCLIAAVFFAGV